MGLGEHLEELRRRVLLALVLIVPIFLLCIATGQFLLRIALEPVSRALRDAGEPSVFQVNSVIEPFGAYVKIATVITLATAGPWVLYQLWKFVAPGLYSHEKRFVYILIPFSSFMAVAGLLFAYFVVFTVMLKFLVVFNAKVLDRPILVAPLPEGVKLVASIPVLAADPPEPPIGAEWINTSLMERRVCIGADPKTGAPDIVGSLLSHSGAIQQAYRIKDSLDLVITTCLASIAGFQTPAVVLVLGWAGLVTPKSLGRIRRIAVLISAVAGAVLTPSPDPFSMAVIAVPLYLLYELGIVLLHLLPASRVARRPAEPAPNPTPDTAPDADGP